MAEEISLETAQQLYEVIDEAIQFHGAVKDGLVDAVIWDSVVPTKDGGNLCMTTLLEKGNYSQEKRSKIEGNLQYWDKNYEALRTQVFYRDNPAIRSEERKTSRV